MKRVLEKGDERVPHGDIVRHLSSAKSVWVGQASKMSVSPLRLAHLPGSGVCARNYRQLKRITQFSAAAQSAEFAQIARLPVRRSPACTCSSFARACDRAGPD